MPKRNDTKKAAPVGVEYEGPSGIARESTWLTHEDLIEGRDLTVKIEAVLRYPRLEFEGGREKVNPIGLKFAGKARVLLLNSTNRKVLNEMYSSLTKTWKGQTVVLFVTETEAWGDTVKCVRIRKQGAKALTVASQFLMDEEGVTPPTDHAEPELLNGLDDPAERERLLLEDDGDGERGSAQS